jgi:uncharacterized cupin superfamily protein
VGQSGEEGDAMVAEATLEQREGGMTPAGEGWFVVNVSEAAWVTSPAFDSECVFEGGRGASFKDVGVALAVLAPGRPNGLYHREMHNQEDFMVLSGECLLLIEGEERALKAWDFVHCPPGTAHIFVGAGEGPCVILMVGARKVHATVYPRSELALRHGAGVEVETRSSKDAYAKYPAWQPGGAETWEGAPRA